MQTNMDCASMPVGSNFVTWLNTTWLIYLFSCPEYNIEYGQQKCTSNQNALTCIVNG